MKSAPITGKSASSSASGSTRFPTRKYWIDKTPLSPPNGIFGDIVTEIGPADAYFKEKGDESMIEVKVNPGICGLKTEMTFDSDDMQTVTIDFKTDCPSLKPLEEELKEADGYEVSFAKFGEGPICELGHEYCRHPGCPVPAALIKGIEAASGLALPKNAEITIEKK
jgi:hypothetical protein